MKLQEAKDAIVAILDQIEVAPAMGITPEQEALDIAAAVDAAVKPLQDQLAALGLAKADEDAAMLVLQDLVTKIKDLLK